MILRQVAAIGDPSSRQAHEPFDECRCWAGAVGVVRGGLALTRLLPLAGGVIIGVGSVITAVAFAQGSTKSITDSIQSMGSNLINISITGRGSNRFVTYVDLKAFADAYPDDIAGVAPSVSALASISMRRTSG